MTDTFIGRARREQLVAVTVELVAQHGRAGCSLQRIADAAGLSKPAVVYHFRSKDAVLAAAYEHVLDDLVAHVGAAVDAAATPAGAVEAYVVEMVEHLVTHPAHIRMLVEGAPAGDPPREQRWGPLAALVREARGRRADVDPRVAAVVLGGAIDGVLTEFLADPEFDTSRAVITLQRILGALLT